ncbi:MAG: T9SS type A sorting domain-containing protein [Calditrichia bacterium]
MFKPLHFFLICLLTAFTLHAQGPQIRVEPDTLRFDTPRLGSPAQNLMVFNDGNQPLTISLTDTEVTRKAHNNGQSVTTTPLLPAIMRERLKDIQLKLQENEFAKPAPQQFFSHVAEVITDPVGDSQTSGVDIVSVDVSSNALFYSVSIEFAGAVDTSGLALLAIDIDQNMATGEFPAPLGFGIGSYDLGADFNLIFDISNLVGDSLGIAPSAIAITGDGTFTPVGLPSPLSINGNTVSVSLLRALTPIFDDNCNLSLTSFSLGSTSFPDLAPDFGHGRRGNEDGLSWLAHSDSNGASDIPFTASIPAGDSASVTNLLAAVNPEGSYTASLLIANNSSNAPNLQVPVEVTINALESPAIDVAPAAISDTLMDTQGTQSYQVVINNSGDGSLIYFLNDSSAVGEEWFSVEAFIPIGRIESGQSESVTLTVNPTGLTVGQAYSAKLQIISNDSVNTVVNVPVNITIESSTSIDPEALLPQQMSLHGNYPNPFNPSTTIRYELSTPQRVSIAIFDAVGRVVRVLNDSPTGGGGTGGDTYSVVWDGKDNLGNSVGSGVYYYRLSSDSGQSISRKMVLLK